MEDAIRQRLGERQYEAAFELLLAHFQHRVFRLAVSILRSEASAEDATQEVFVKIWRALPTYHGRAAVSTWIYAIARNTCLTELKRRSTRPTVSLQDAGIEAAADSIDALQSRDTEAGAGLDVAALLAALPAKYRRVITLFYMEQKAYTEVAAMLGIPLGTVKVLLFRAKKELLRLATRRPGGRLLGLERASPQLAARAVPTPSADSTPVTHDMSKV